MSDIAIRVKDLGKLYKISAAKKPYKTFRETFMEKFKKTETVNPSSEFWALKDVSFDIKKGEVVGIIGRNGAGKSTLLKILSRITEPTVGEVDLYGRVGSLLEVGTGFHPELTGRENIYLNGAILGMKRLEINLKFDEIVAFAELEKFIDTPVKHYSSGMYMRLAFAVAAHMQTEILMVDEVLAVGDAEFQKKCLGKMDYISKQGKTIFFVSHNINAINELCGRAILLENGIIKKNDSVSTVVKEYFFGNDLVANIDLEKIEHKGPQNHVCLKRMKLFNARYEPAAAFIMNEPLVARIEFECFSPMLNAEIGLKIISRYGATIHYFVSSWEGLEINLKAGRHCFEVKIPNILLYPGQYQLGVWILKAGHASDDHVPEAGRFEVLKNTITGYPMTLEEYGKSGCEVYALSHWTVISSPANQ